MKNEEQKGWKYYLFKKRYPPWIYTVVLAICAIAIYIWIRYLASL